MSRKKESPGSQRSVAELEAIIARNKGVDEPRAYQLHGAALSKLGDISSKAGDYERAARLHGEAAEVYWRSEPLKPIGLLAWIQQAWDLFRLVRLEDALEKFEDVIALDGRFPNFVQLPDVLTAGVSTWLLLVEETGDYERLYRSAESAIEWLQPVDTADKRRALAGALIAKGTAEREFGRVDAALASFQTAIDQCSVEELAFTEPLCRAMLRRAALLDECGNNEQTAATYVALLNRFASVPEQWAHEAVATAKEWLASDPG